MRTSLTEHRGQLTTARLAGPASAWIRAADCCGAADRQRLWHTADAPNHPIPGLRASTETCAVANHNSGSTRRRPGLVALDAASFSSVLAAGVASVLTLVASAAMGTSDAAWAASALAAMGTLCVYNVDRLRDLERDRHTTPLRTAFVERHRGSLKALAGLAGLLGAGLVVLLGPGAAGLCGGVAVVGLFHRRLKHIPVFKSLYVSAAWITVTVGIPALIVPDARNVTWIAFALGGPVVGNLIVSSLRDGENAPAFLGTRRALGLAQVTTGAGGILALLGPATVQPLAWVAACSYLSLLGFRPGERYGLHVVDGSLLIGGFAALAAMNY